MKLYLTLFLVFMLFSSGITFVPAEVGDIKLDMTNIRLSPGATTQRDVTFEPFALYQVEANTTPINGPEDDETEAMVLIEIRSNVGGGGKTIPFREGSHAYNGTFRPLSSSYRVEITSLDDVDIYWVNLTITQIEDPLVFTIPSEGLGYDVVFPLLGITVVPLLVLFIFVVLKQKSATKERT